MSKTFMRTGTLIVILVLALASVGVGYGLWSETLFINGTVNTGTMDTKLDIIRVWEDPEAEGKNVGNCNAVLNPDGTITFTMNNAYPYYTCWMDYKVTNIGSIPVHVYKPIYFYSTFYGAVIDQPEIYINCWEPPADPWVQLHTGDYTTFRLKVTLKQAALENHTYTFTVKIFTRQWNEIVAPNPLTPDLRP